MPTTSYTRIIKSSSIVGGAQFINMLIGMGRVKFVAILIGPAGFGLLSLYQTIVQMVSTIFALGLNTSAVREIAQGFADKDQEAVARSTLSLRRMCWISGILGASTMVILSTELSQVTFGDTSHSFRIRLVGVAVFIMNLHVGQIALVQGARRIGDLAKINIIGAAIGSILSVVLYFLLGVNGIVPAIIALAMTQLIVSYYFARKVVLTQITMTWVQSFKHVGGMLRLGIVFMWNGLLLAAVAYATRIIVGQQINLEAVGIYTAAFALSGMVVNFVLGAMATDYLPALSAVADDHGKMCKLVNEQTEIGLLLALPALLTTLALAPWVVQLFYSTEFAQAGNLLRWFMLGCFGRVVTWPISFIFIAKGMGKTFAANETFANLLHIILILVGLNMFGLVGAAIAFFILYIAYCVLLLSVSRVSVHFYWSRAVVRLLALILPLLTATFLLHMWTAPLPALIVGLVVSLLSGLFCLRGLARRLGPQHRIFLLMQKLPFCGHLLPTTI